MMGCWRWLVMVAVAGLVGCSAAPVNEEAEKQAQYWPELPELPRFKHVFTLKDGNDLRPDLEEQSFRQRMTGQQLTNLPIPKPFSMASRGGRLYVSDTAIDRIHVFDFARRKYFQMGFRLEGQLSEVQGLDVDAQGMVYAVDRSGPRVVRYDQFGLFLSEIKLGSDVVRPSGVAVTPEGDRIFVVDTGGVDSNSHRVLAYSVEGERLAVAGDRGLAPGRFNLPVDAEVGPDGLLYVLDAGNFRVQVFDRDLNFVREWGRLGKGLGQFARPRAIAIDASGVVYVSDAQFANVQLFDAQGQLLMVMGRRGGEEGELGLVAGIAVDDQGNLYAADQNGHKVEIYDRLSDQEAARALAEFNQRWAR